LKCRVCKTQAIIHLPRHNSAFCKEHFIEFFHSQVRRAIHEFKMFKKNDRILVCVSGGKDSLSLWYCLTKLGYQADGLYVNLGIEQYSKRSAELSEKMAQLLGRRLIKIEFDKDYLSIKDLARRTRRTPCSVCGTVKRYYFNKVAIQEGYSVVATGHNLDDEAARLLGNILRWQLPYLQKQYPVLEEEEGLKRKVKPLCRLTEQEVAAYAFLHKIEYILQECPMSRDSTSLLYKRALNIIETESPGTKHYFYLEFLKIKEKIHLLSEDVVAEKQCKYCGMPTFSDVCSFCKLTKRIRTVEPVD